MNSICISNTHVSGRHVLFIPILIAVSVICIGLLTAFCAPHAAFAQNETVYVYESVQIQKDDTLWDLASHYAIEGQDIRSYIQEIRSLNRLTSDNIYEGEYLIIPVQKTWYELSSRH